MTSVLELNIAFKPLQKASTLTYPYPSDDEYGSEDEYGSDVDRYYEEVAASDGFDVVTIPKCGLLGSVTPLVDLYKAPVTLKLVEELSVLAIEHYNKEHKANYKFMKVVKANSRVVCGAKFYITFEAKDAINCQANVFQGLVWRDIEEITVLFCRIKPAN